MKSLTKGVLAAGGAVLLIGGAGTLAYWTAEDSADGGSINAGSLTLTSNDDCDDWTYAAGSASAGQPVTAFVPGDVVTTTCTFTVGAEGDNLSAAVTVPSSLDFTTTPSGTSFTADVDAGYTLDGAPLGGTVTDADDGKTLAATFEVTIPYGDEDTVNANDTQDITATLDTLTVSLTQQDPN